MSAGPKLILAIDQGTTGTTVLLFDAALRARGRGYREIPQSYPAPGQVEHDPEAIWQSVVDAIADARRQCDGEIAAVGITNQRETAVLWDRGSGKPVAPAIVWQDRRTADLCERLRAAGHEPAIQRTTGLLLDPYFSATKVSWLLDRVPDLRSRAERGLVAFGTIDAFLLSRLTSGRLHATDPSNASRTLLYDINRREWSAELCQLFRVPMTLLPEVRPTLGVFGQTSGVPGLPDGIPIAGVAGDQQAALYGQRCVAPGDAKCTYGTGSFMLMNVGNQPVSSRHQLLCSVAWTSAGGASYALEGSSFVSGALVQWLRDGLGIIQRAADIEALARSVPDSGGVTIVPALVGLGAPYWRPHARGLIAGLTRGTTRAHIARAALEAMALQTVDLARAMEEDSGRSINALRVDGGAASNDLLMQIQADLLGADILRPAFVESTALGAALLAARAIGLQPSDRASSGDLGVTVFHPRVGEDVRRDALARWRAVVEKA